MTFRQCALVAMGMQTNPAEYGPWVTAIRGVAFVAVALLFRRGIVGELARVEPVGRLTF